MKFKTYMKRYFLSDLIILTALAALIYLPGKLMADTPTHENSSQTISNSSPEHRV